MRRRTEERDFVVKAWIATIIFVLALDSPRQSTWHCEHLCQHCMGHSISVVIVVAIVVVVVVVIIVVVVSVDVVVVDILVMATY